LKKRSEQFWALVQSSIVVAVVVVNLPHGAPVDAAHAGRAALFRLAVSLFGLVGILFSWWMARRAKSTASHDADVALGTPVVSLTYQSTAQALWRCNLRSMRRPKTLGLFLSLPIMLTILCSLALAENSVLAAAVLFLPILLGATVLFGGFILLLTWLAIRAQFATKPMRMCTTTLTPTALVDVTPEKTTVVPWQSVADLSNSDGDVFFWTRGVSSCFVPREAFGAAGSASFFALAQQLKIATQQS
jgi:hypothetical protein